MKEYTFNVEGIEITILVSSHAQQRMDERSVTGYMISGAIMMLGESILDMRNGDEFIIVDNDMNASYVCGLNTEPSGDIYIDIITVVDTKDIWNKQGTRIYKLEDEKGA